MREFLLKSPIYAMSLGNKELFHSNFWAWLIARNPSYAAVFFPNINESEISEVTREEGSRDITIRLGKNSTYIIENKLKSVPYTEQLKRYTDACDTFTQGLLTGIMPCELPDNWNFTDYQEIGVRLKQKAEALENDEYFRELIIEYSNVIICINKFINEHIRRDEFLFGDLEKSLRFDDVIKKLQAEKFKNYLVENVYPILCKFSDPARILISSDYSHGEAMVNVFYKTESFNIGICIQGKQFRRVISKKGSSSDIYAYGKNIGYFKNRNDLAMFGEVKMRGEYCKYDGSIGKPNSHKETHVYQYWNIKGTTFSELSREIINHMEIAARCIL